MLQVSFAPYRLQFKEPATTSRNTMTWKDTYFIKVYDTESPERFGLGECALFAGLSADDVPHYEDVLSTLCQSLGSGETYDISGYSSIRFGLETALLDYEHGCTGSLVDTPWTAGKSGIEINGLVWMGSIDEMKRRVHDKIAQGFRCVKFKIGGCDFNEELRLLDEVRLQWGPEELEIRLDANGAFAPDEALDKLTRLSVLDIHSIEQPIAAGQWERMSYLCANSPIDIALDEELIGVNDVVEKRKMLYYIAPRYIILKPALCGGLSGAEEWIDVASRYGVGWWATSALESNVGLNAIAQWVSTLDPTMPQGLGTGNLYVNNIESPLYLEGSRLRFNPAGRWHLPQLQWRC